MIHDDGPIRRSAGSAHWQRLDTWLKARYMADEPGQAYAQQTADRPRFLVEITPTQITTWRGGPWHRRYYSTEPTAPPPTAAVSS